MCFMLWQDVLLGYYPISMCLGCLNVRYMSKRYHSNGRWLCITLNCEIMPMRFGIVILSQCVLELWYYPNTFWNCEIIPMRFGIVILSQCVLKLWYYPNYRISWSLGAAETEEAAVWARNLMSTIKQLPVMYHLSTLSSKRKELSCFKIYCLPLPKEFLGGVDAGQVYLRINWKLSKIILLILFFHPVNKLSFKSAPP